MMEILLIYAATGAAAGLLAGLFGVGGGLIMVPALALVLSWQGLGPGVLMQVAVGTSLGVIAATSVSSMLAHHRRGGVLWPVFARLVPGLAAGAVAGAFVAHALIAGKRSAPAVRSTIVTMYSSRPSKLCRGWTKGFRATCPSICAMPCADCPRRSARRCCRKSISRRRRPPQNRRIKETLNKSSEQLQLPGAALPTT
jgi:hypothetical protein